MKTALYHIRIRCNFSQSMVAKELNISRQLFSAWETGKKAIPSTRKAELSHLFGINPTLLDEQDENKVRSFCDQAVFSRVVQGRQVFSFKPMSDTSGVFLETPNEQRTEERCIALMGEKRLLLEQIDEQLRFDPQRQANQLSDMETAISVLRQFSLLLSIVSKTEPHHQGRVLQFLLEQFDILYAVFGNRSRTTNNSWLEQQTHLLRCHWGDWNRRFTRVDRHPFPSVEPDDPDAILSEINRWYQHAKHSNQKQSELQWELNQFLEKENLL